MSMTTNSETENSRQQSTRESFLWDLIHAGNCRTLALLDLVTRIEATYSLDDVRNWPEFAAAKKALEMSKVKAV
jgi:hypothetical protein